jgi:metallo-beta-lactamase class B
MAMTVAMNYIGSAALGKQPLTDAQAASGQFKVDDQGTEIKPAAQAHFDAAQKAAGAEFLGGLLLCNEARPVGLRYKMSGALGLRAAGGAPGQPTGPTRIFDNLYYLGVGNVTSWAVATPKGIILIDSLNNKREVMHTVEAGLRKYGLDPAQIKYVVVTHGHGDHYGGAAYIEQKYHAHVLMSDADWKLAPTTLDKPLFDPPPPRDWVIHDGEQLTVGGETLSLYITPGHTLGTVSVLIPVTDRGQRHVAALWGGAGFNFVHSPARFKLYAGSAQRFMRLAAAVGADVPLANHPENDSVVEKISLLKSRGAGDSNPFVMGKEAVRRYFTTFSECALAYGSQLSQ